VQESYEALRTAKQEFANDFRRLLKGYLDVMDNVDVASAKEIEASLRERLDLESVAVAREAAETRRSEQDTGAQDRAESEAATRRIETPAGEMTDELGPVPEVEEPEMRPSSAQSPADQEAAASQSATAPGSAAEEVDREEPMPAREGRAYDEFFETGGARTDEPAEGRKLFRASRFLRRRG
jgi:cell division initiation protein